jgi:hypothetical protein
MHRLVSVRFVAMEPILNDGWIARCVGICDCGRQRIRYFSGTIGRTSSATNGTEPRLDTRCGDDFQEAMISINTYPHFIRAVNRRRLV